MVTRASLAGKSGVYRNLMPAAVRALRVGRQLALCCGIVPLPTGPHVGSGSVWSGGPQRQGDSGHRQAPFLHGPVSHAFTPGS